jgi:hypothetical protein
LTLTIGIVDFTGMPGHFGLTGSNRESPPAERLLETNPYLDARELYRAGALIEGVVTEIKLPDGDSQRARHEAGKFYIGAQAITVWSRSHPRVFVCPLCSTGRYKAAIRNALYLAGAA